MIPDDLSYTAEHEWIAPAAEGVVRVGITHYAQSQLGDVVFVQLPTVGETVTPGSAIGEVESTKSVSDVFSPLPGEVTACNEVLADTPELVNSDPYGAGWMFELRPADPAAVTGLLSADDYRELTGTA